MPSDDNAGAVEHALWSAGVYLGMAYGDCNPDPHLVCYASMSVVWAARHRKVHALSISVVDGLTSQGEYAFPAPYLHVRVAVQIFSTI